MYRLLNFVQQYHPQVNRNRSATFKGGVLRVAEREVSIKAVVIVAVGIALVAALVRFLA
jgi:hypothetical protein